MSYKYLVIVESPTKAKTIDKYLGKNYKVVASKGHLRDLPKSKMGVDIDNQFEPHYISIRGRGDTIKELRQYAKKAEKVFLAADPDREGEAIAWHLSHLLALDTQDANRVVFNEITKDSVKEAFKHPRHIDQDLVDSQQARRVLDRIVGYSISPLLWKKIKKGLSAGRVQSTALKLIVDREREIKAFQPEEYWTIPIKFKKGKSTFEANFHSIDGEKASLSTQADVEAVMQRLNMSQPFNVVEIEQKERRRKPAQPFTTSTLQQEASNRMNFRTSKTMMVAQQLYEGITIGRQTIGLITYMRTDSTRISPTATQAALHYIEENFGKHYVGQFKQSANRKGAQDAHEAIRPTDVTLTPSSIEHALTKDQMKLYSLIWARFMASQMSDAIYDTVRCDIDQKGVTFRANGSHLKFDGFLKVYPATNTKENMLPPLNVGESVEAVDIQPTQHFTQPPARYTEASLVKTLEEQGIGRPSTYSPTIETLRKRYYVKLVSKRFEPTELGEIVNDTMAEFFPRIVNTTFTAEMEQHLDEIEEGQRVWQNVLGEFYDTFKVELSKAEIDMEKIEIKDEQAGFDCTECGNPMLVKIGRFGKFYACSNFPDCRHTQAIVKKIDVKCPQCHQGEIIERQSKKNRLFYGCDRYPECEFVSWDKPLARQCPKCSQHLVEKVVRKQKHVACSQCDYTEKE